jgi:hypothetical protein
VTPAREAIILPLTLLTVVLLGGIRFASPVAIEAPSLFSLVLASLMLGVLVQSGTLDPARILHAGRTPLANANGLFVVAAAFAATAQMISLLVPAAGLPSLGMGLFFFVAILQLLAGALDRALLFAT